MKKTHQSLILFILSIVICITMTSCSLVEYALDNEMHGELELVNDPDSDGVLLIYQGTTYYPSNGWINVRNSNDDEVIELGYRNMFPFPPHHYYAFSENDPTYIFIDNGGGDGTNVFYLGTYLKEDFNFRDQVYYIPETEIEIVLSEAMTKCDGDISFDSTSYSEFYLCLKDDPRLEIQIRYTYKAGDDWYIQKNDECWLLDKDFAEALTANGIIA